MNGRRLYEEIGGVNERYLQEATTYRARRKAPVWRTLLIAAALVLVGALLLGTLALSTGVILLGSWLFNTDSPEMPEQDQEQEQEQVESYTLAKMESVMQNKQTVLHPLAKEQVPLFTDSPYLIWTDGESGVYYRVQLGERQVSDLLYLMQEQQVDLDEDSEMPDYKVWILLGDGMVISPYLKANAGNAGHGELFDYDPELELSEKLIKRIIECIET